MLQNYLLGGTLRRSSSKKFSSSTTWFGDCTASEVCTSIAPDGKRFAVLVPRLQAEKSEKCE